MSVREVVTAAAFKVNPSASFSTNDRVVEARRQLPGDPLPTAGCTSCKRSTVRIPPRVSQRVINIETRLLTESMTST